MAAALALLTTFNALPAEAEQSMPLFANPGLRLEAPNLSALPRLRFLTTTDFPPFNSLDTQGRLVGFNIDLAREICAELDLARRCEVQALPWDELQPALARGDGEAILAGVAVSARSRQTLAFTQPYLRFPGRFVTLKTDAAQEPLWQALDGSAVGVVAGSVHEKFLRERFPGLRIKTYPGIEATVEALESKQVRTLFGDGFRLSLWLNGDAGSCCRFAGGPYWAPQYFGSGLAVAVRPGERSLVDALNYALHRLAAKPRFTELTLRWFPVSFF